jgi:hypothetical protein
MDHSSNSTLTRVGREDYLGVPRYHVVIAQAHRVHLACFEILCDNIRPAHELLQDWARFAASDVNRDRLFPACTTTTLWSPLKHQRVGEQGAQL